MRDTIAYVATFVFAFILVTAALFITNEKYTNIFRLDFTPRLGEVAIADSLRKMHDSLSPKINVDSISQATQDSLTAAKLVKDSIAALTQPITDEHGVKQNPVDDKTKISGKQLAEAKTVETKPLRVNDSSYVKWKRLTLGIFETMDSKQIARLIVGYSDDVARDLIYSMKKKKAGEVLSQLTPEMFHRITKVQ